MIKKCYFFIVCITLSLAYIQGADITDLRIVEHIPYNSECHDSERVEWASNDNYLVTAHQSEQKMLPTSKNKKNYLIQCFKLENEKTFKKLKWKTTINNEVRKIGVINSTIAVGADYKSEETTPTFYILNATSGNILLKENIEGSIHHITIANENMILANPSLRYNDEFPQTSFIHIFTRDSKTGSWSLNDTIDMSHPLKGDCVFSNDKLLVPLSTGELKICTIECNRWNIAKWISYLKPRIEHSFTSSFQDKRVAQPQIRPLTPQLVALYMKEEEKLPVHIYNTQNNTFYDINLPTSNLSDNEIYAGEVDKDSDTLILYVQNYQTKKGYIDLKKYIFQGKDFVKEEDIYYQDLATVSTENDIQCTNNTIYLISNKKPYSVTLVDKKNPSQVRQVPLNAVPHSFYVTNKFTIIKTIGNTPELYYFANNTTPKDPEIDASCQVINSLAPSNNDSSTKNPLEMSRLNNSTSSHSSFSASRLNPSEACTPNSDSYNPNSSTEEETKLIPEEKEKLSNRINVAEDNTTTKNEEPIVPTIQSTELTDSQKAAYGVGLDESENDYTEKQKEQIITPAATIVDKCLTNPSLQTKTTFFDEENPQNNFFRSFNSPNIPHFIKTGATPQQSNNTKAQNEKDPQSKPAPSYFPFNIFNWFGKGLQLPFVVFKIIFINQLKYLFRL